jgi:tRNA (guanine37-N1)-methyltransferase
LALICGHYEGIDERVATTLKAKQISIGDYVLTGGEIPALVIIDAVTRLRSGVIDSQSIAEESHSSGQLEYPQYTRPDEFRGQHVPDVLLSGHHHRIAAWRRARSLEKTARQRPDLLLQDPPRNDS